MNPLLHTLQMTSLTDALWEEVDKLLSKDAIELVLRGERTKGFFSRYVMVLKRDRGLQLILDLQDVIVYRKFWMVSLQSILPLISKGEWLASLDLQDAYFHITIHPPHMKFLRFVIGNQQFQYKAFHSGSPQLQESLQRQW